MFPLFSFVIGQSKTQIFNKMSLNFYFNVFLAKIKSQFIEYSLLDVTSPDAIGSRRYNILIVYV